MVEVTQKKQQNNANNVNKRDGKNPFELISSSFTSGLKKLSEYTLSSKKSKELELLKDYINDKYKDDQYVSYLKSEIDKSFFSDKAKVSLYKKLIEIIEDPYYSPQNEAKGFRCYLKAFHENLKEIYNSKDALLIISYYFSKELSAKPPKVINNNLETSKLLKLLFDSNIDIETINPILGLKRNFNCDSESLSKFVMHFIKDKECKNKNSAIKQFITQIYRIKNDNKVRKEGFSNAPIIDDSQIQIITKSLIELCGNYISENTRLRSIYNSHEVLIKDKNLSLDYFVALNACRELIISNPDIGINLLSSLLENREYSLRGKYIYDEKNYCFVKSYKNSSIEIKLDKLVEHYKNSLDYKISENANKILEILPDCKNDLKQIFSLLQTFDLNKKELNQILTQIIDLAKADKTSCDIRTLIKHLPSLFTSDPSFNKSKGYRSFFYKPYMRFLTNINKKVSNDEKVDFYLKISEIVEKYDKQIKKNPYIELKNKYYDKQDDTDFLSLARLQDLRFIDGIASNISKSLIGKYSMYKQSDNVYIDDVLTILSEKYFKLGNDIQQLNNFKDSLLVLYNMTSNLQNGDYQRGTVLNIIQDLVDGKASGFVKENLSNTNVTFKKYMEFVINTLSKESKYVVNDFVKDFSRARTFDIFEDDDDDSFEDLKNNDDESFITNKEITKYKEDEFVINTQIDKDTDLVVHNESAVIDNDSIEVIEFDVDDFEEEDDDNVIEVINLDEDDFEDDESWENIFEDDISKIDVADYSFDELDIAYNLASFAKNHTDSVLEEVVDKLGDLLSIDSRNASTSDIPDKKDLARSILCEISHQLISQYAGTCLTTSLEYDFIVNKPQEYIDFINQKYEEVLSGRLKYSKEQVGYYDSTKCMYYEQYYPSLVFFQTIGDNLVRLVNNEGSEDSFCDENLFKGLGLSPSKRLIDNIPSLSPSELIVDIAKALDDNQRVIMYYSSTYVSSDGHAVVPLSVNKNKNGDIVSFNVFNPNYACKVEQINIERMKNFIYGAVFL